MRSSLFVLKEHFRHRGTIFRLAKYEKKAGYRMFKLGYLWEVINPCIQIGVYYLIFGVSSTSTTKYNVPYIIWLLAGIIPWFYISSNIVQGANSIYSQLGLISKTNFSTTVLPSVTLLKNLPSFLIMWGIFLAIMLTSGLSSLINIGAMLYYIMAMIGLLFAMSLLNATITILFRDFQLVISSSMRLLVFLSGVIVQLNLNPKGMMYKLLHLNPWLYIIEGFRKAMFALPNERSIVLESLYFWSLTTIIFTLGAFLHQRYKKEYINYI